MRLATCHELPDVDEALVRLQEVGLQKELFLGHFFQRPILAHLFCSCRPTASTLLRGLGAGRLLLSHLLVRAFRGRRFGDHVQIRIECLSFSSLKSSRLGARPQPLSDPANSLTMPDRYFGKRGRPSVPAGIDEITIVSRRK